MKTVRKADDQHSNLRPPETVMRLERMGSSFQTRLSFMRQLIRRMRKEKWQFEKHKFDVDGNGYGTSVFVARTPERCYSLIAFTRHIDPEERTDRVIAQVWDATFSLFDGIPSQEDIERLSANTPKQEGGRFLSSELCLARANKSTRLFEHVVNALANGRQPEIDQITSVGYLMRTTAVYGSGKFGCADFQSINSRDELQAPFQAEMITVYLIRWMTIEIVNHVAKCRNENDAVELDEAYARYLGIGNSTGLGMAPFVIKYPVLIHNWVMARENALADVRAIQSASKQSVESFRACLASATSFLQEWNVADEVQMARIIKLREEIADLAKWCKTGLFSEYAWEKMLCHSIDKYSLEGQEFTASLALEPHGELVDKYTATMSAMYIPKLRPAMKLRQLHKIIADHYEWALDIDFSNPETQQNFWYYSEEKLEPRIGNRYEEPGQELEMPVAIARDVNALNRLLENTDQEITVAELLMANPLYRHIIPRIQAAPEHPYGEICDNLLAGNIRALDLLRFKLGFFGVSKFDPKSDLWTRVNIYHGAPLPHELQDPNPYNWVFPTKSMLMSKARQA